MKRCRPKYKATPPAVATPLISSGRFSPCQMASVYSGNGAPGAPCSAACAATPSSGPAVSAGTRPTARHSITSSPTGSTMKNGASCGFFGRLTGSPLKKTSCTKRRL